MVSLIISKTTIVHHMRVHLIFRHDIILLFKQRQNECGKTIL